MASSALTCNSTRVLTPERRTRHGPSLRSHLPGHSMTSCSIQGSDWQKLSSYKQPGIFDQERRTITIKSGKAKASQISRNVCLSDKGLLAVEEYLKTPSVPELPMSWQVKPYPVGTTGPYSGTTRE